MKPVSERKLPKTLRPPVKWHGGKHYLCHRIIAQFPEHSTYVEPFGGAASVLLNKKPAEVEVYNDLDERIVRLFRTLRERGEELRAKLLLTPYSEKEFELASQPAADELEQCRRDFIRWRMSLGGRGDGFSFTLHRVRRGMADVVSGYLSTIDDQLPAIANRFRTVQIMMRPAVKIIRDYDSLTTLFYCDPPYVHATRHESSRDLYGTEMTDPDHRELAAALHAVKGKVVLSGYPSPLYDELYGQWRQLVFDLPNNAAGGKTKARKQETLWMNW